MGRAAKKPAGPWARALSAEVRALLGRHNLTQAQLAEAAGMSKTYLGDRLRDAVALDLNDIEAIATVFGMTPRALMELAEQATANVPTPLAAPAPGESPAISTEEVFLAAQSDTDDEMLRKAARARRGTTR